MVGREVVWKSGNRFVYIDSPYLNAPWKFPTPLSQCRSRSRGSGGCSPLSSYHIMKLSINSNIIAFLPHTDVFVLRLNQMPIIIISTRRPFERRRAQGAKTDARKGHRKAAERQRPPTQHRILSLSLTDSNSPFVCLFNQSASPFLLFCLRRARSFY